jgi:hypothetical protein
MACAIPTPHSTTFLQPCKPTVCLFGLQKRQLPRTLYAIGFEMVGNIVKKEIIVNKCHCNLLLNKALYIYCIKTQQEKEFI